MNYLKSIPEIALYAFLSYISIFIIAGGWLFFIELFFDFEYIRVVINLALLGSSILIIWIMRTYFYKSFIAFYHSVKYFKRSLPASITVLISVFSCYLIIIYILDNLGTISVSTHPDFWGTINSIVKSMLAFTTVAICEEIVYRGFLYNAINNKVKNRTFAVIVSSLIFSIAHFHYDSIVNYIVATWAGLILCILYVKYKSLYPSIFLHFGWNFSYVFFSLIQEISPYENNPLIEINFFGVFKQFPELVELYILFTISILFLVIHFIEKLFKYLKKSKPNYSRLSLSIKK